MFYLIRPRGRYTNNTRNYGYYCDQCQSFINKSSAHFVQNKRKAICTILKYLLNAVQLCAFKMIQMLHFTMCTLSISKWIKEVVSSTQFSAWPATDTDKKRVQLGIREIVVLYECDGKRAIEWKKALVDGKNIRKSFKLVLFSNVTQLEFSVDY